MFSHLCHKIVSKDLRYVTKEIESPINESISLLLLLMFRKETKEDLIDGIRDSEWNIDIISVHSFFSNNSSFEIVKEIIFSYSRKRI